MVFIQIEREPGPNTHSMVEARQVFFRLHLHKFMFNSFIIFILSWCKNKIHHWWWVSVWTYFGRKYLTLGCWRSSETWNLSVYVARRKRRFFTIAIIVNFLRWVFPAFKLWLPICEPLNLWSFVMHMVLGMLVWTFYIICIKNMSRM